MNYIYDPVGLIATTEATYDETGEQITQPVYADGFHVNTLKGHCPGNTEDYAVNPDPTTPRQLFAGVPVEEHLFLRFDNKEQAENFFGIIPLEGL